MKGRKCSIWMELTLKSHVAENLKKKTQPPKIHTDIPHFKYKGRHSGKRAHSVLSRASH